MPNRHNNTGTNSNHIDTVNCYSVACFTQWQPEIRQGGSGYHGLLYCDLPDGGSPLEPPGPTNAKNCRNCRQTYVYIVHLCVAFHRTCPRTLPGRSQKSPRRMPGHSWHSFTVSLNICHRLIAMATGKRQQLMKPLVCFFASFTTSLLLISYLSRLQSFTDPSAAHDARLTSEWSREIPAWGRKTTAPTLVLCPADKQEEAH